MKRSSMWRLVVGMVLCGVGLQAAESPAEFDARMRWFQEARFGMFIHWGVYAVPAGEWEGKQHYGEWFMEETKMPVSRYEQFAKEFNPVKFNAEAWVKMAADAGMKYIVITSKHHDGFGMFRSALTDWCIKSTPFPRDPLKELAAACQRAGIRLCFYHSIMDWHHPDWGTRRAWNDRAPATSPDMDRYVSYMKGQLKELLTGYGPIGILWFDGEWESPWTHERGLDLYRYVRQLQPGIIVNNRVGKGRAGMDGMDRGQGVGDYGTPEQEIPATGFGPGVVWESCMTMNNHWGYNRHDQNWKSTETLVRNLIECASKGGNYLLNVGPTAEGLFPEPSVERLAALGRWMKANSEGIYGTGASPFKRLAWGRCTQKTLAGGRTRLYLHVFDWPQDRRLLVPGLKNRVVSALVLASRSAMPASVSPEGVILELPGAAPDPISSTLVLDVEGVPEVEVQLPRAAADGSITLMADDAITHGSQLKFEAGARRDCLGFWLNSSDWAEWSYQATRAGRYRVTAMIAATGSGRFTVTLSGSSLTATAPTTGDYGEFKAVDLGTLSVSAAGPQTLVVKPMAEGWQPMNLRAIELLPAP